MTSFIHQGLLAASSLDPTDMTFQEQQHYSAKPLGIEIYKYSYALPQIALSCGLFAVGGTTQKVDGVFLTRQRPMLYRKRLDAFGGGHIEFSGEELHQGDKRVFMALVHAVRNRPLSATIDIHPKKFVAEIGWSNSKNSFDNLKESIERLQDATLEVLLDDGRSGLRTKMVGVFERDGERWRVELNDSVREIFLGSSTFVSIKKYRFLRDGLQTWLWHFLSAQYDETVFDIADLHRYSGSIATLDNFSKNLRQAVSKLVAAEVFAQLTVSYGRLRVLRSSPFIEP